MIKNSPSIQQCLKVPKMCWPKHSKVLNITSKHSKVPKPVAVFSICVRKCSESITYLLQCRNRRCMRSGCNYDWESEIVSLSLPFSPSLSLSPWFFWKASLPPPVAPSICPTLRAVTHKTRFSDLCMHTTPGERGQTFVFTEETFCSEDLLPSAFLFLNRMACLFH